MKQIPEYQLPKNDFVFKRIFGYEGNEDITKDLISSIIGENINKIKFKNPYLLKDISVDKEEILDIKAELDNNTICDIEIQVANDRNLIKRIIDYWAKLYTQELHKGKKYHTLKRTILILITNFNLKKLKGIKQYSTKWKIIEEKLNIQLTDIFEIDIIELPKARKSISNGTFKRTDLNDWVKFILNPLHVEEIGMDNLKEEIKKAYEVWQSTNQNEEEREKAERRYLNLLSIEDNMQYERKLGRKEAKIEDAKKMLEENIDISIISRITGLSENQIKKLQ